MPIPINVEMWAFGGGKIRRVWIDQDFAELAPLHDALSEVYRYGQNEVQPMDHPSVSVGDIIQFRDRRYLVVSAGFRCLTDAEYDMVITDPILAVYAYRLPPILSPVD